MLESSLYLPVLCEGFYQAVGNYICPLFLYHYCDPVYKRKQLKTFTNFLLKHILCLKKCLAMMFVLNTRTIVYLGHLLFNGYFPLIKLLIIYN